MERAYYTDYHAAEEDHWWFRGRRGILLDVLRRTPFPARRPVVEVGCGPGANIIAFSNLFPVVGLDMSAEALRLCRQRGVAMLVRASGDHLPFRPASLGGVLALDVLEHIRDDRRALSEMAQALHPEGRAVITVPAHRILFGPHDRVNRHFRRYSIAQLRERMNRAFGTTPESIGYLFGLLFLLVLPWRIAQRIFTSPALSRSDLRVGTSRRARGPMELLMRIERRWARTLPIPIGVSVLAVSRRADRRPSRH